MPMANVERISSRTHGINAMILPIPMEIPMEILMGIVMAISMVILNKMCSNTNNTMAIRTK